MQLSPGFLDLFTLQVTRTHSMCKYHGSSRQHAFRKIHSCETQLTTVINDWTKILDNRGQVDTFILDFEKTFDTPPHEILESKLFSYGIGGKTGSFLCFRQQRVVVNGIKSD